MSLERIQDAFPDFSDGVSQPTIDDQGNELLTTDSAGQGPLSGSRLRSEWLRGVANGDFHDPPTDPSRAINDDVDDADYNPLPGWTLVDASNGAISWWWVADSNTGSGAHVEARVPAGLSGTLSSWLTQSVPVRSTPLGDQTISALAALSADAGSAGSTDLASLTISQVDPSSAAIASVGTVEGDATLADAALAIQAPTAETALAANAAAAVLSIGVQVSTSSAHTVTWYEVLAVYPPSETLLPDISDLGGLAAYDTPETAAGGKRIYVGTDTPTGMSEGDIWIKS